MAASRASATVADAPRHPPLQFSSRPAWQPPGGQVPGPQSDPARAIAFKMALALVFLRFSMLHQILTLEIGKSLPVLYVFGIPAIFGLVLTGGVQRTLRGRPAIYWCCFAGWVVAATPFSWWKASSLHLLFVYFRTDFIMLFVIAGLAVTWRECKLLLQTVAWSSVVNLMSVHFIQNGSYRDRLGLDIGSIGNPNDFACHLLLTLPFLLWMGLSAKSVVVRLASLGGVAYGIYVIVGTASRGAAIALAIAVAYFFFRCTMRQRIALAVLAPIALGVVLAVIPADTLRRITSFSSKGHDASEEAMASTEDRQYLLKKSIAYAVKHPIFGIGPGQFSAYEGSHNIIIGTHGLWRETHNTYTQVASECGFPALLFFLAAIISTYRLLDRTYQRVRGRPGAWQLESALFSMKLAMVGFGVAIGFLTFGYYFYLPAMSGLAMVVTAAVETAASEPDPGGAPIGSGPQ